MRSATSCSKTLIRSDWRRFWPIGFLYALFSFFALPMTLWAEGRGWRALERSAILVDRVYAAIPGFVLMNFFFGLALAMAVYAYLMAGKSVGLMHALPVSRDRQFFSHFAAGLSLLTAANCLTLLLALGMEALLGGVELKSLLLWLAITELTGFFFLAFAALAAMVTGWLLAVPVIYLGWNFMVWAYSVILQSVAQILFPNYGTVFSFRGAVEWLTPVSKLFDVTTFRYGQTLRLGTNVYGLSPKALPTALIYAAVGVAMLGLAWLLYRARHSETAGDAIAFRPLRPVARYVISIAAGLALGTMVYEMVTGGGRNVVALILWQMVMGGLVYCAVEMLLRKSFRIFDGRTLLGLAALWLVLAGVCLAMKWDITGYEKRVPQADRVEMVEVYGNSLLRFHSEDADTVQAVIDLHSALVKQGAAKNVWVPVNVVYHLRDGSTLSRRYDADLGDPAVRQAATDLISRPEIRRGLILEDYGKYGQQFVGGYGVCYATDKELVLTAEQCLTLYRAMEADMETPVTPEQLAAAYIGFSIELTTTEGDYNIWRVRQDCANTLAALKDIGLIGSTDELEIEEPSVYVPVTSTRR